MTDTIFALSSGAPPAAIGVIRVSGPCAEHAVESLCGGVPTPRKASLRTLRNQAGETLDRALVLWLPGPKTATGEDCAEFHCHGGRAVVAAIEEALAALPNLRRAEAGEFTRRAFANGVIDLAEAEGLGDLLAAETQLQRRAAEVSASGGLSRKVEHWRERLLALSALVESQLDFSDEDDVGDLPGQFHVELSKLADEWKSVLAAPPVERLRDGVRVVLAGPPNAGKSSLFNALLDEGAAIVSAEAGTTRDAIERPIALGGTPFVLVDTAGLRESGAGEVELIGIEKARQQFDRADIILWLGEEGAGPEDSIEIASRCDLPGSAKRSADYAVSAVTGEGVGDLVSGLVERARSLLPLACETALNRRQRSALDEALDAIGCIDPTDDLLVIAERLRLARVALDRLLGRQSTEAMLDALFGKFCIGK